VSEEGRLGFLKPFYGGKINAWIKAETDGAVLTFESGYFKGEQGLPGRVGTWAYKKVAPIAPLSEMLETLPAPGTGADLRAAQTIVAAGRGVGKPENLERIRTLAAQFPRSAVAGSRPLCDLGWLQYNQQVGQTGATVSPRLYLACGISGAYQHVAGMKDSGFIVSINRDSRAAISNWADLCVVEDLETFVPLLIASLQALKKDE
jgi:electron transfer flavoprotein alpha subunit